jgi:hypothetical protein
MASINVFRDFPIINGFVQLAPNYEADKNEYTIAEVQAAFPEAEIVKLSHGSGRNTSAGFGVQRWIRIPGITNQAIWDFVTANVS